MNKTAARRLQYYAILWLYIFCDTHSYNSILAHTFHDSADIGRWWWGWSLYYLSITDLRFAEVVWFTITAQKCVSGDKAHNVDTLINYNMISTIKTRCFIRYYTMMLFFITVKGVCVRLIKRTPRRVYSVLFRESVFFSKQDRCIVSRALCMYTHIIRLSTKPASPALAENSS